MSHYEANNWNTRPQSTLGQRIYRIQDLQFLFPATEYKMSWSPLLSLSFLLVTTSSLVQEYTFYEHEDESGNFQVIHSPVSTLVPYTSIVHTKRYCRQGVWAHYIGEDYMELLGYSAFTSRICFNGSFPCRSFRFLGAPDTDNDGLSMYADHNFVGKEVHYVNQTALALIREPVRSLAWTGGTEWEIFEGTNFDGKSTCLPKPPKERGFSVVANVEEELGMTFIGSVWQKCTKS